MLRHPTARALLWSTLIVLAAWPASHSSAAPPAFEGDHPRYRIEVRLDEGHHVLDGRVEIHLPNHCDRPLHTLEFHLYANAFAHDATVFMREQGYALRDSQLVHWGGTEVGQLRTAAGTDLLRGAQRELVPGDQTQLRVPLPQPLLPGQALDVVLVFRTRLPNMVARMGYAGDFHMLAQWFPKLAKLRADGTWDNFPYHGMGEFYADFADYEVTLDVPAAFVVAGSGQRVRSRASGARRVDVFEARRVHDVAYVVAPGLLRTDAPLQGVRVQFVYPAGYGPAMRRQRALVDDGLRQLGSTFGRYPWDALTVLIPPPHALPISAMEYPTFMVTGGPWWALPNAWPNPAHDVVTFHELAHQWFHGAIATHEVQQPFLDEGLTQWATADLLTRRYGDNRVLRAALGRGTDPFDVIAVVAQTFRDKPASSLLAAHAYDQEQLAQAIYVMPPLVLETIARTWGRPRLLRVLALYAREQRFGHPTRGDLFAAFDRGYWPGFSESVLRPALEGRRAGVVVSAATGPGMPPSARRTGTLPLPLQVRVTGDGRDAMHEWPADRPDFVAPGPTQQLVVDPARRDLLARRQDLRTGVDRASPGRQWWSHLVFWVQQLLVLVGP